MRRSKWLALLAVLALALAACGYSDVSDDEPTTTAATGGDGGVAAEGKALFSPCAACHGQNAEGINGLGNPLANSAFVQSKTDDELVAFIVAGRPIDDPDNTTGVAMPAKGGTTYSEEEIAKIVAYLRTLN
jgi:mono/diheme cytochrome c family protein